MKNNFSTVEFHQDQPALRNEWLLTNGLGSYTGSTTSGANTRKYHGLLIAAFNPPVDRRLLVSKNQETMVINEQEYNLSTDLVNQVDLDTRLKNAEEIRQTQFKDNKEPDNTLKIKEIDDGKQHLISFSKDPYPTYTYRVEDILIEKEIFMVPQKNITVVNYKILTESAQGKLKLKPLLNSRDHHSERFKDSLNFKLKKECNNSLHFLANNYPLYISWSKGEFTKNESYFEGMYYPIETHRGECDIDDHYIPGEIVVDIDGQEEISMVFSTEEIDEIKTKAWQEEYLAYQNSLLEKFPEKINDSFIEALVLSADDFITYRKSTDKKTIMAGYPWFTDWGRDTMIALPGIALVTGRHKEAKEILTTFALSIQDGLLPNVFDDYSGEAALYNTVDASLWFFYAIKKYYDYTKDKEFLQWVFPKLESIIKHHIKGTKYNIKVDNDGLLSAGSKDIQLTWMDAKAGDWVVTPRHGKAVEINALWYNALKTLNELAGKINKAKQNKDLINKIEHNFLDIFWYQKGEYLYDVVNQEKKDSALRPNQIFAVSLPYSLLDKEKKTKVVNKVYKNLYTPLGLRSLAPNNQDYHGLYKGRRVIRDATYHQGITWGWLIGHFFEAYLKINNNSKAAKQRVKKMYLPFKEHLNSYGLGSISEIFDGDFPFIPRGCPAQAWSVAELLRIHVEYLY